MGMAANKCVMWRNGCRLFVQAKLERGTPEEYPVCYGTDAVAAKWSQGWRLCNARVGTSLDITACPWRNLMQGFAVMPVHDPNSKKEKRLPRNLFTFYLKRD